MAWYRAGTVAVTINSKTVTGTGTQWASAVQGIGAGQMLLIPGDGTITAYEIASVDSNTKITLVNNYTAATGSGKSYAIVNTYVDSVPDFARRLAAQIAYYQTQMDGLNSIYTGTGNVTLTAPDGTVVTVPSYNKLTGDMTTSVGNVNDMLRWPYPDNNANTQKWILLGTYGPVGQNGPICTLTFYGAKGFNGFTYNTNVSQLQLRTGNIPGAANVNKVNRIGGQHTCYMETTNFNEDIRVIESADGMYDVYVLQGTFVVNCYYTVEMSNFTNASGGRWTHKGTRYGDGTVAPDSVMKIAFRSSVSYLSTDVVPSGGYAATAQAIMQGFGGGPVHRPDLFNTENRSYINRWNATSLNRPADASLGAVLSMPVDGGPSCTYLGISTAGGPRTGVSNTATGSNVTWYKIFSEITPPAVADISNLKDWGLSLGVTSSNRGSYNAQMQSRMGYVSTDPIGNPFKDTGTHYLNTHSWSTSAGTTDDTYRTVQVCYGYGVSGAKAGQMYLRGWTGTVFTEWKAMWGEANTTVDSNGFIKKASPIVKVFGDGAFELNDESEGVTVERLSTGVYHVKGTIGFNADAGWGGATGGIEIPLDLNKRAQIWVDYEIMPDGDIELRTYHREHKEGPVFARNIIEGVADGDPIDIPAGRWVDLRVQMPTIEKTPEEIANEEVERNSASDGEDPAFKKPEPEAPQESVDSEPETQGDQPEEPAQEP